MTALVDIQPGDIFEAPWGRYVHRGVVLEGRPVLADLANPGSFVAPSPARIGAGLEYVPAGKVELRAVRVREVRKTEADGGAVVVQRVSSVHADSGGPVASRAVVPARTTLGALRPVTNSRGMVRGADGAGSVVIIPDRETLYWIPCSVEGPALPLGDDGEAVVLPHAFFISSSFRPGIYCLACRFRRARGVLPLPDCAPEVPLDQARQDSPAPPGALASSAAVEAARVAEPPAPPLTPPRGETAAALEVAPALGLDPEIAAIAARIEQRYFDERPPAERAKAVSDLVHSVRMPPHTPAPAAAAPPAPPKRPAWHNEMPHPNRADMERAEWWDERAAIIQEGAKCKRETAERLAYDDMKRAHARGEIW